MSRQPFSFGIRQARRKVEKLKQAKDLAEGAMALLMNCYASYVDAEEESRRLWNHALFKRRAVGGRQGAKGECAEHFRNVPEWRSSNKAHLVARSGFEPLISALRGLRPGPLDERAAGPPFYL